MTTHAQQRAYRHRTKAEHLAHLVAILHRHTPPVSSPPPAPRGSD
jgi:hypothetical protein